MICGLTLALLRKQTFASSGSRCLIPVVRDVPSAYLRQRFCCGQLAGVRVGCAAVASARQGDNVIGGETIFLLTTLRSFGNDGLEAALRTLGRVDEVTLVDQIADATAIDADGVVRRKVDKPPYLPESTGLTSLTVLAPQVTFPGTLVERLSTLTLETSRALLRRRRALTGQSVDYAMVGISKIKITAQPSHQDPSFETASCLNH